MATWIDVFSLAMTTIFFVGTILGILYVGHKISLRYQSWKTSLGQRGINISREGVSFKTEKRFDQEHYLDATRRGLVKVLGAASTGPESHQQAFLHQPQTDVPLAKDHEKHHFGVALHRSHNGRGE